MITTHVLQDLAEVRNLIDRLELFMPAGRGWSGNEQQRFWQALTLHPTGPWTQIATHIGSKSTRQVMTHAQKLRQKLRRWKHRNQRCSVPTHWPSACHQHAFSPTDSVHCATEQLPALKMTLDQSNELRKLVNEVRIVQPLPLNDASMIEEKKEVKATVKFPLEEADWLTSISTLTTPAFVDMIFADLVAHDLIVAHVDDH